MPEPEKKKLSRRDFFRRGALGAGLVGVATATGVLVSKAAAGRTVWQIDPAKCIQCGRCATECVLDPSAVKCVQAYALCGYCDQCFGYFPPGIESDATLDVPAAEAQLCPTGAINRKLIKRPHYEYSIDEDLCIGCGKCVKGCTVFGNGSFFLQTRHNLCLNCNQCKIAAACPADAWRRVPASQPYLLKEEVPET
jgi:Na+-translocating ferredoxin:NAD+ oxidoreductase subunit B